MNEDFKKKQINIPYKIGTKLCKIYSDQTSSHGLLTNYNNWNEMSNNLGAISKVMNDGFINMLPFAIDHNFIKHFRNVLLKRNFDY